LQKRSHKLLASSLLLSEHGFGARRFEAAFLFGSFQPDCNPLSYLKGSVRAKTFRGHNFSNSQLYINRQIKKLRRRSHWTIWQYYTLGKLTHYLADAFTYPHNENYSGSFLDHHRYETGLRLYLAGLLSHRAVQHTVCQEDLVSAIEALHHQYMASSTDFRRDAQYILKATELLMASCLPTPFSLAEL